VAGMPAEAPHLLVGFAPIDLRRFVVRPVVPENGFDGERRDCRRRIGWVMLCSERGRDSEHGKSLHWLLHLKNREEDPHRAHASPRTGDVGAPD